MPYEQFIRELENDLGEVHQLDSLFKVLLGNLKRYFHCEYGFGLKYNPDGPALEGVNVSLILPIDTPHKSLIEVSFKTSYPIIANNIKEAFLYNPKIDNPFDLPVNHLGVLPILRSSSRVPLGLIVLYRKETSFNQNDFHHFENLTSFISTFLRRNTKFKVEWERVSPAINFQSSYLHAINKLKTSKQFFYSIIHDIRTPLNAMMGFLQLLLKSEEDPEKRDFIKSALNSGEMIIGLINDLLDMAKLEEGKLEIEKVYFTPITLFEDVSKLFYFSGKNKGVEVVPFFDPRIPFAIFSDNHRLNQVLNNLLSNAIKFTPEGGKIFFRMEYIPEEDRIFFSVRDTGIGIPKEAQKRLFKPYEQVSAETSKKFGGTGLGLYISKQLVEMLGGQLQFKSEVGKGTEFFFSIPSGTVEECPPTFDRELFKIIKLGIFEPGIRESWLEILKFYFEKIGVRYKRLDSLEGEAEGCEGVILGGDLFLKRQAELEERLKGVKKVILIHSGDRKLEIKSSLNPIVVTEPLLPKKFFISSLEGEIIKRRKGPKKEVHVLAAEDEVVSQKLLRHIFSDLGAKATIVGDGLSAVDYFREHKGQVDIIFLDQNMPQMGGIEAAKEIRKIDKYIPIYILSGEAEENLRPLLEGVSVDGVLTKPIRLELLESILESL
ncbi:MAG: ATP-binding protein [Campylobacterales bacterium]